MSQGLYHGLVSAIMFAWGIGMSIYMVVVTNIDDGSRRAVKAVIRWVHGCSAY